MSDISQTSCLQDEKNILLNDFEYPKDAAIVIEESTSQVRTDSTRWNSKRLWKFSLLNGSVFKDEILS